MAVRNAPRRAAGATRTVAIDISTTAIRAVEVEIRGDEVRLLKRGAAPAPPGIWDDVAAGADRLAAAIKLAMTAGGISATHLVAALPRRLVTLKYARLPHAEPEQIRGMVQFEAQQYIPFPLEDVVIDHQIVSDETDEMTTVMIVAARRTLVESLLAVFDRIGIEVTRLSVSALALAEHARLDNAPLGLLEVEAGEIDLAVVADGRVLFTRAATLEGDPDSVSAGPALAGEVARSLTAYQNEYRAQPVSKLLVAGAPDEMPRVMETLDGLLQIPVARMNGRLLPSADSDVLAYATAIGLAVGGEGRGLSRINLVPSTRAERKVAARRRANTLAAAAAVAIIAVTAGVIVTRSLANQRVETAAAARENRKLDVMQGALKRVKTGHDYQQALYHTVSSGLARNIAAVDVVKAISDAVPKGGGVYLTQFAFDRTGAVTLHGNAKNETAATDLVIALQGSGEFSEVRLAYLGDAQSETTGAATANPNPAPNPAQAPAGGTAPAAGAAAGAAKSGATGAATAPTPPPPPQKTSFIITCRLKGAAVDKPALRGIRGANAARNTGTTSTAPEVR